MYAHNKSSNSNSRNSSNLFEIENKSKPFCKVCKDAGKTIEEYTNHYVKSNPGPTGYVVCPTLLSLNCNYCHEKGHTISYCKKILTIKKNEKKIEKRIIYEKEENEKKEQLYNNKNMLQNNNKDNLFSALFDEDDNDTEQEIKKLDDVQYPLLALKNQNRFYTSKYDTYKKDSYANILAREYIENQVDNIVNNKQVVVKLDKKVNDIKKSKQSKPLEVDFKNMNWADIESDTDSESETE